MWSSHAGSHVCRWAGGHWDGSRSLVFRLGLIWTCPGVVGGAQDVQASSVSWEHTQMFRGEGRMPDSTPKGQHSLKGGCSAETSLMGVPWMGSLLDVVHWIVIHDGSWFDVGFDHGVNHGSDPLMRHMGVLVSEEPCGVQGPIRLDPTASKGEEMDDLIHGWWIKVSDLIDQRMHRVHERTWFQESTRLRHGGTKPSLGRFRGDATWLVYEWACDQMDQLGLGISQGVVGGAQDVQVTAIGEWVRSGPLMKSMARNETEGMQWLPLCPGNTLKWSEEKGECQTPLPKANTASKLDVVHWIVIHDGSWFDVGFDHGVNHGSDPLMRHMEVLVSEEPCGVQSPIRLDPTASKRKGESTRLRHGGTKPDLGRFRYEVLGHRPDWSWSRSI
ncbi:hypothetical protein Bca52824_001224 [Brassica carinata]|uniref:Uncharacterized protein n=1 Tax=Brassica carinata TaxID=52824 RepID=A0A8X7WFV8_BRACI|nr:hypothetical protein Bca52824_001224 [Brassica carinata]